MSETHTHFYFHFTFRDETVQPSDLAEINRKLDKLMATLSDVQAAVTAEKTVVDSVVTLLSGLSAKISALEPNQAAIDQLAADVKSQSDALAAAVEANTPPTPEPPTGPLPTEQPAAPAA